MRQWQFKVPDFTVTEAIHLLARVPCPIFNPKLPCAIKLLQLCPERLLRMRLRINILLADLE